VNAFGRAGISGGPNALIHRPMSGQRYAPPTGQRCARRVASNTGPGSPGRRIFWGPARHRWGQLPL